MLRFASHPFGKDFSNPGDKLWRIRCFFVDRDRRHRGLAAAALRAAIEAIQKHGASVVEACPATSKNAVGIWFGTVGMFEEERFKKVSRLGRSSVVMRRRV